MPEGPEVRKFADELASALKDKYIIGISARTKKSREWLDKHPNQLHGKKLLDIFAYGKNLIGIIDGPYFFYSHQMMWGHWEVIVGAPPTLVDRRERARIVVEDATAILMSAPVFEIGEGDPFEKVSYLHELGPNALLYPGEKFETEEFLKRLTGELNFNRTIGSALLDQTIVAGLGNYLRAEILFEAKLDPWRTVRSLSKNEIAAVSHLVPLVTERAYTKGATVTEAQREKMRNDSTLVYVPGKEYGTRHYVFRRTNLPCLICGTPIKQMRQETGPVKTEVVDKSGNAQNGDEEEEKTRIIYFCQKCQQVTVPAKIPQVKKARKKILDLIGQGKNNQTSQKPGAVAPVEISSLSNDARKSSQKQLLEPKENTKQKQNKKLTSATRSRLTSEKKAATGVRSASKQKKKAEVSPTELVQKSQEVAAKHKKVVVKQKEVAAKRKKVVGEKKKNARSADAT
jgi:formamidopyrimidine-DNA glycosylase